MKRAIKKWEDVERALREHGATDGSLYCYRYVVIRESEFGPRLYVSKSIEYAHEMLQTGGGRFFNVPTRVIDAIEQQHGKSLAAVKKIHKDLIEQVLHLYLPHEDPNDLFLHARQTLVQSAIDNDKAPQFFYTVHPHGAELELLRWEEEYPAEGVMAAYLLVRGDREFILGQSGRALSGRDCSGESYELSYCDGNNVALVSYNEALMIVEDYKKRIRSSWKHKNGTRLAIETAYDVKESLKYHASAAPFMGQVFGPPCRG